MWRWITEMPHRCWIHSIPSSRRSVCRGTELSQGIHPRFLQRVRKRLKTKQIRIAPALHVVSTTREETFRGNARELIHEGVVEQTDSGTRGLSVSGDIMKKP